jgi:hypothetical protein
MVYGVTNRRWKVIFTANIYLGIADDRLRLITPNSEVLPLPEEAAIDRAERAEAKLARWAEKLRELSVDPDRLE